MASVAFTDNLKRHVACPPGRGEGLTIGQVLEDYFCRNPAVRSYVLDEHGSLRKHMAIFVDGRMIRDRVNLTDPVSSDAEVFVMQALSGG